MIYASALRMLAVAAGLCTVAVFVAGWSWGQRAGADRSALTCFARAGNRSLAGMSASKASQFASTGGLGENKNVEDAVKKYEQFHSGEGWNDSKKLSYMDMVNKYYDLATSFYEFGWGECFHFAHRLTGETLRDSLKRHEHYLAAQGRFEKGDKVQTSC